MTPSLWKRCGRNIRLLQPLMTERLRRQWAACEAESLGRGGVSLVAQATGLSRTTIWAGRQGVAAAGRPTPRRPDARARSGTGRWSPSRRADRCGPPRRLARPGRIVHARGPPIAPVLDLQEHAEAGRGAERPRSSGEPPDRRGPARSTGATACKPTARPRKVRTIPIATPSSSISTGRCAPSNGRVSRSSRWMRRRRN